MVLSFILMYFITLITKRAIQKRKRLKTTPIVNPREGGLKLKLSDGRELGLIILSCIADNENYLVKDPRLTRMIFHLVKKN